MNPEKRDFNLAARIFLYLSLVANLILVISCFVKIRLHSSLEISITQPVVNMLFTIAILITGMFIFRVSKIALTLFISLFIARLLVVSSLGGGYGFAFNLGGNMWLIIRDLVPFMIALCFRKDGISGWKAFFSKSQDEITENKPNDTTVSAPINENTQASEVVENVTQNEVIIENTSKIEANNETTTQEIVSKTDNTKIEDDILSDNKPKKKTNKKIIIPLIIIGFIIISMISYINFKTYPDYISEFGNHFSDKWKYTFNQPNDSLAIRVYRKAMDNRYQGTFLMYSAYMESYTDYDNNSMIYDNTYDTFPTIYALTDTIHSKNEILEGDRYGIYFSKADWNKKWKIIRGNKLYEQFYKIEKELETISIIKLSEIQLKEELKEETRLFDIITDIPISDVTILEKLAYHFKRKDNYTKLSDLYKTSLKAMEDNSEVNALLASTLYKVGDKESAVIYANRALELNEKELLALEVMCLHHADKREWKEAKQLSRKAIDYGAESSTPYYVYACASYETNDKSEAQNFYNRAANLDYLSPLREKYEYCAGAPFIVLDIEIGFSDSKGNIITKHGQTLYSSKSKYIDPIATIKALRPFSCTVDCKLYANGKLSEGQFSENGYTYTSEISRYKTITNEEEIGGWGNNTAGNWKAGNYRFEIWYKGEKMYTKNFKIY